MYNRYIRNESGTYTRVSQESAPSPSHASKSEKGPTPPPHEDKTSENTHASHHSSHQENHRTADGLTGFLRHILDQFHLDRVDTGDVMLLVLLFFLFRENADEELLVSLGLLLIL